MRVRRTGGQAARSKAADRPRVSGAQPSPAIIAGKAPGEWLIAWLDFEAGVLEPYAARFVCK